MSGSGKEEKHREEQGSKGLVRQVARWTLEDARGVPGPGQGFARGAHR